MLTSNFSTLFIPYEKLLNLKTYLYIFVLDMVLFHLLSLINNLHLCYNILLIFSKKILVCLFCLIHIYCNLFMICLAFWLFLLALNLYLLLNLLILALMPPKIFYFKIFYNSYKTMNTD